MSRQWRPLPDGLSNDERALVDLLRQMRDNCGLTLIQLSAKTHHSKSSWQRWLNGERPVTEQALQSLAEVSGMSAAPGLALLARIAEAGPQTPVDESGQAAEEPAEAELSKPGESGESAADPEPAAESAAAPEPAPARGRKRGLLWGGGAVLVAAALAAGAWFSLGNTKPKPPNPDMKAMACDASGCANQDPKSFGCADDAVTLTTVNVDKRTVYLRYSRHCRAAWAKLTDATVGDKVSIADGSEPGQHGEVHWGFDAYSMMVDASGHQMQLRVCGYIPNGDGCSPVITDPEQVAKGVKAPSPAPSAPPRSSGASTPQ